MTQEPRPTPELWRLEYLRKWHGQPEPILCVKWFGSELWATKHRDDIVNGKGEFISLAKYVLADLAYVLPDPPRTLTPEQVERAKYLFNAIDQESYDDMWWIRAAVKLLREVVGE